MKKTVFIVCLISYTLFADMLPQHVLAKNCLQSYKNSYLSQNNHKAFVYARENETDKDRCNWGYGYATEEEAIDSAMKGCQSVMLDAECMLVNTDGKFSVKDGVFTTLTPVDETALSKEEVATRMKEAKSVILGNCLPFFEKYLGVEEHKSFAYSVDANGYYACGYSYNNQTEKISKKTAIQSCKENKVKRGPKAPKSACKVYATNKTILLSAKDYDYKPLPKVKALSAKAYAEKMKQAQKIIHNKACMMQYKYYLKSKIHNAYYLVQGEYGKQMCGRFEGAVSVDMAKQKAKESCEKYANEKHIIGACRLLSTDLAFMGNKEMFAIPKAAKVGGETAPEQEKKTDTQPLAQKKVKNVTKPTPSHAMQTAQPLAKALSMAVDVMNKTLPMMTDEETRLDKVTSEDKKMTFHYTLVHLDNWSMPKLKLHKLIYNDTKSQVCSDKETQGLLKKGAVIAYSYSGKDNKPIETFVFDAKVCGVITNKDKLRNMLKNLGKK